MTEDSSLLAWIGILLLNAFYVTGYDLWATFTNHYTMSAQFRDWMHSSWLGPILISVWVAIFLALTLHFVAYHNPPGGK